MTKRLCPFKDYEPYVKKQMTSEIKTRGIRSESSEKTLQLLYEGASKQLCPRNELKPQEFSLSTCFHCSKAMSYITKCFYCDRSTCRTCISICEKCNEEFCANCSFPIYSESSVICYSCY